MLETLQINYTSIKIQFSSVQSLSHVRLCGHAKITLSIYRSKQFCEGVLFPSDKKTDAQHG